MSVAPNSISQPKPTSKLCSITKSKALVNPQLNVLSRVGVKTKVKSKDCGFVLEKNRFYGTRLRGGSGQERQHLWQSDGPGRAPKLKVVVKSSMSQVPEKPLGLYDSAFDKDSCGVGFVAELSGQSSRKTVKYMNFLVLCTYMYLLCVYVCADRF